MKDEPRAEGIARSEFAVAAEHDHVRVDRFGEKAIARHLRPRKVHEARLSTMRFQELAARVECPRQIETGI